MEVYILLLIIILMVPFWGFTQDCVDDPDGILESYSYQCNDIVGPWFSWGCDDDLSVAVPGAPSGMWTIGDLCPQSCNECDEENVRVHFMEQEIIQVSSFNIKFQFV